MWSGIEECDDGEANADDGGCTTTCAAAVCGDGLVWAGHEACDDGAGNADDQACTAACAQATCGDGLVWQGSEGCDDGNATGGDGCSPGCRPPLVANLADSEATLVGEPFSGGAGASVAGVGDLDGDGWDDVLIGAPLDGNGTDYGTGYVVHGPIHGTFGLQQAVFLLGEGDFDHAATSVAAAGDVDGDGLADLWIGAPLNDEAAPDSGAVYLVRGPADATLNLTNAAATLEGVVIGDVAGVMVGSAGDLNHDGHPDVLVGAPGADSSALFNSGAVYVVFGPASGTTSLSEADVTLLGELQGDNVGGGPMAALGDWDGDGVDDVAIGTPIADVEGQDSGGAYVVLGGLPTGSLELGSADAVVEGTVFEQLGRGLAAAGDVDGDGLADLWVGAPSNDDAGGNAGMVYLILGGVTGDIDATSAPIRLSGEITADNAGASVAGNFDFDGDGAVDVAVGAPYNNDSATEAGAVYVVLRPSLGTGSLADADIKLTGEAVFDRAGAAISTAGDVNGDGLGDLLVGASLNDEGGSNSGAAYLVVGGSVY